VDLDLIVKLDVCILVTLVVGPDRGAPAPEYNLIVYGE
jgi:hypothetical protein